MPENQETREADTQVDSADDPHTRPISVGLLIVAVGLFIAGLLALGVVAHYYVTEHSASIKFFAGSSLNLLILVAILVQAYIYVRQWDAMERSLGRTDKIIVKMREQLEAINKQEGHLSAQAKAAETQTEVMQGQLDAIKSQNETLKLSVEQVELSSIYANRAYVTASIEKIAEGFQFHLRIKNNGNTPANDVHVSYRYEMREKPPYDVGEGGIVVYDSGFTEQKRLGLIGPGRDEAIITPTRDPFRSDSTAWNKWKLSQVRYYVWGRIDYEDIFNQKRHTDFSFFQGHGYPYGYPCEYGNEAY